MAEETRPAEVPRPMPRLTVEASQHQLPDGRYLVAYHANMSGPRAAVRVQVVREARIGTDGASHA